MMSKKMLIAILLLYVLAATALPVDSSKSFTQLSAHCVEQTGTVPEGAAQTGVLVLANEPNSNASISIEFDLSSISYAITPLARLQLDDVGKLKVNRLGQKPGVERGALHVFAKLSTGKAAELVGTIPVKPAGLPFSYVIDITGAVTDTLAQPQGQKKLHLEVRMEGKPCFYEVYGMPTEGGKKLPTLEIASPVGWTNDWEQRLVPISSGPLVYRESCMPLAVDPNKELTLQLLYPAKKITEVIHNAAGAKLQEGRDWILRDGKLVLPAGSHAPIQRESEFFAPLKKDKDGTVKRVYNEIRLEEGTWYHERQIEVSYEPTVRDWSFPPPISSLDNLPRLKRLLTTKSPVRLILFGDSISVGGNASKVQGCWPYQPCFGELVVWKLEQYYGNKITFMNHSRGGGTASYGVSQVDSQVGWFKPDLAIVAFGMNDRSPARRVVFRASLEKIIDTIRARSPETEFIILAPFMNNPVQPTGSEPILAIRDEALKISRPGLAYVDVTTAHQEILKHKKNYLDLSGNGANHPNDFLHRIYAQRLLEVLIPDKQRK